MQVLIKDVEHSMYILILLLFALFSMLSGRQRERLQQGIYAEGSLFVLTHNFFLFLLIMLILCIAKILTYSIDVLQPVCKPERSKISVGSA